MKLTTRAIGLSLIIVTSVLGTGSASFADEYETADGGTVPYVEDSQPAEGGTTLPNVPPAPGRVQCDNAGWRYDIVSHADSFEATESFGYINESYSGADTFVFEASRAQTSEWSVSTSVSASGGIAMFAEVKAEVSAGIKKSTTYGVRYGGTKRVPPRTVATAKIGFLRTVTNGKSYYWSSKCAKTNVQYAILKAPTMATWVTSTRPV